MRKKPELGPVFNLKDRIIWSWAGWRDAWSNEASLRSWVYANIISDALAFYLPIAAHERMMIVVLGVLVLAAELLNTGIERLADLVDPKENPMIKASKDAASTGVALTALAGGVAWLFAIHGLLWN